MLGRVASALARGASVPMRSFTFLVQGTDAPACVAAKLKVSPSEVVCLLPRPVVAALSVKCAKDAFGVDLRTALGAPVSAFETLCAVRAEHDAEVLHKHMQRKIAAGGRAKSAEDVELDSRLLALLAQTHLHRSEVFVPDTPFGGVTVELERIRKELVFQLTPFASDPAASGSHSGGARGPRTADGVVLLLDWNSQSTGAQLGISTFTAKISVKLRRGTLRAGILSLLQKAGAGKGAAWAAVKLELEEVCSLSGLGPLDLATAGSGTRAEASKVAASIEEALLASNPLSSAGVPAAWAPGPANSDDEFVNLDLFEERDGPGPHERHLTPTTLGIAAKVVVYAVYQVLVDHAAASAAVSSSETFARLSSLPLREFTWFLSSATCHPGRWAFDEVSRVLNVAPDLVPIPQ